MNLRKLPLAAALCALFFALATWASAAPITAAPTRVTQPDGTALSLYSSGDEFFNYIHDAVGNLIMRREDGWYVYAVNEDGLPTPTGAVVGEIADGRASLFGMDTMTAADIDFSAHRSLTRTLEVTEADGEEIRLESSGAAAGSEQPAQLFAAGEEPRQKMANLVIFIRFPDEDEFVAREGGDPVAPIPEEDQMEGLPKTINFGDSYRQVSQYMKTVSNGNFNVETTFLTYDKSGSAILSCVAPKPRSHYEQVDGSADYRFDVEMELLEHAVAAVAHSVPEDIELDYDHDGYVDNITFIVSGATAGWNDLLWPHSWAMQRNKLYLKNWDGDWKQCFQFNFNFANPRYAGVGVLSHELLHAVGYPDLYRYDYSGDPVGGWDAMGSTDYADPQFIGAYLKDAYTSWGNLGHISASGTYTLAPLGTPGAVEGYQIPTGVVGEYICVEYRKSGAAGDVTEDNVPCDGLLVYRANRKTTQGNRNGTVNGGDEVYVFRPGDATPNAGTKDGLKAAALDGTLRTALGAPLDSSAAPETTLYLDSGTNSGVVIDEVTVLQDGRISFRVTLPDDPTSISPGRYDVDGDDYFIDQSGSYTFYGSTTRHDITVAANTKGVNITFEGAEMDLSAQSRSRAPLTVRAGAEVTVRFAPGGEGETFTLLSGSAYMPGLKVEKGAKVTLIGAGGEVNASGGTGAPGVGSDAFSDGGSLRLEDLHGVFSGGGSFKLDSGGTILMVSNGSAALGGGFRQSMDGLTIVNCTIEAQGGGDVQAISTGYLDHDAGEYIPGGELVIENSTVTARGSVDGGARLTARDSRLQVTLGTDSRYHSALNATETIALTNCHTVVEVKGTTDAIMNRNTRDTCAVELRGGSAYLVGRNIGLAATRIAVSADTDLAVSLERQMPLVGPWDAVGEATGNTITAPVGEGEGTFLRGSFAAATPYRMTYSLEAEGMGRYVELPAGAKSFVVSLPAGGTYTLRDEDEAASGPLAVLPKGVSDANDLVLRAPVRLERRVDVSSGGAHLTENGVYLLSGEGTGQVTVADGRRVTIYLDNVTLDGGSGPALSVGQNTTATIIAKRGTDNRLTGAPGHPAIRGEAGSALSFRGTGLITAHGGAGAAGVDGAGRVTVEQVTPLVAVSDGGDALVRGQSDSAPWSALEGAEPAVARLTLAEAVAGDDVFTVFFAGKNYTVPVQSGAQALFLSLPAPSEVTLERRDGGRTPALPCGAGVSVHPAVPFETTALQQVGDLDLSLKSYTVTRSGEYTVTGTTGVNSLRVAPGVSARLKLRNVQVTSFTSELPAILDLGGGSAVTLVLEEGTENALTVEGTNHLTTAIRVPASARLTIEGQGALTVSGAPSGATIGGGSNEEGGTILISGGHITFEAPAGSGNSRTALGGNGARVEINGGVLRQAMRYGGVLGGKAARVTVRGGEVHWRATDKLGIGGEQSVVTVQGGKVEVDLARGGVGVGGAGSRVTVQGGEVALCQPDGGLDVPAALGGRDSRLSVTGGRVTGTVQRANYSGYGALGGENAVASVAGEGSVFLRYRHKDARPLANADLFPPGQGLGAFLDVHLSAPLAAGETLTLTRGEDGKQVRVPLETGDAGFFLRLEEGVWHLENEAGGYGGAYSPVPGVTTQRDVTFNRLQGVFLESKTVEYSGAPHTLRVEGHLDGAQVTYSGNSQREPGVYPVTATVATSGGESYTLTATLTITKARLTVTGIQADSKVYNGTAVAAGRVLCAGAKGSDRPQFSAAFRFSDANAGTGKTVTASDVALASALWEGRYELNDVDPALLTTQADITPKPVPFTFPANQLTQLAGVVRAVVPDFHPADRLDPANVTVTYTPQGGVPSQAVPQTAGTYTVTIVLTDPNYCVQGVGTATLTVEDGIDLRGGDLHITAPGTYTVTSRGEPTAHRIVVAEGVSGKVTIYLNGVDLRPAPGENAIELRNEKHTDIYAQAGSENFIGVSGSAAATVALLNQRASCGLYANGVLTLRAEEGGQITSRVGGNSISASFPSRKTTGALCLISDEGDPAKDMRISGHWVKMGFADAPSADAAFSLTVEGVEKTFSLPAGHRQVWWGVYDSALWQTATLRDSNGVGLKAGSAVAEDLVWTDISLQAKVKRGKLDISNLRSWTITESGVYRLYGDGLVGYERGGLPVIRIADALTVELILDDITLTSYLADQPVISLGKGVDLTLTARGSSTITSPFCGVVCEPTSGMSPNSPSGLASSTVKLRGEEGSQVTLTAGNLNFAHDSHNGSSGFNAAICAKRVKVESGTWTIRQAQTAYTIEDSNRWSRGGHVWCIRCDQGGFEMTGGTVTLDGDYKQSSSGYYAGGIRSMGNVTFLGGELTADVTCTGGYGTDVREDTTNAIYVGADHNGDGHALIIDGGRVTLRDRGNTDLNVVALRKGNVELRKGYLSIFSTASSAHWLNCESLVATGGFELLGLDQSQGTKAPGQCVSGEVSYLPGPDGNVPVLYRGQFDDGKGKGVQASNKDTPVTFTDADGVERVLVLPKWNDANSYRNFMVLLPKVGRYDVSYPDARGKVLSTTVTTTEDGGGTMGPATTAASFQNVELPARTVLWDGGAKALSLAYQVLPTDTRVVYTYATAEGSRLEGAPTEPGAYTVTARLSAPGYLPQMLNSTLTIEKRTLELRTAVANKPVFDNTTAARGTIWVEGNLPGDVFTATAAFAFADPNVGTGKRVNVTNIAVSGPKNWADHYDLAVPTAMIASASILEKAELELVWTEPTLTQVYGSLKPVGVFAVKREQTSPTDVAVTVSLKPDLLYDGNEAAPSLPDVYQVTARLNHQNYAAEGTRTLTIQPWGLTFTALPVPNAKEGGEAEKTVTADKGFTLAEPRLVGEDRVGVRFTVHYDDLTAGMNKPATVSGLTLTGAQADRYYVLSYPETAAVTVVGADAKEFAEGLVLKEGTFLWDGKEKSLSVTPKELLPEGTEVKYTYTDSKGGALDSKPTEPGSYRVTAELTASGYMPLELHATLTIQKQTLELIWSGSTLDQSYGSTGAVEVCARKEEGGTELTLTPGILYDGKAEVPTLPGTYQVTAKLDHEHYSAAEETRTLTIRPRKLIFTALPVPDAKVGDAVERTVAADSGFTLAEPGLVEGDEIGVRFTVRYDDLTAGENKPVTVSGLTLTGDRADRYEVEEYPKTAKVTVTGGSGGETPDPGPDKPDPDPEKPDPKPDAPKPKPDPGNSGGGSSGGSGTVSPTVPPEASKPQGPSVSHTGTPPFVDLSGHWAEKDIEWCWQRELMTGMDATHFVPDAPMTRGMFVTILGRLEGIDVPTWDIPTDFADVEPGSWYAPYVAWAKLQGLVEGRDAIHFAPAEPITRQELAVLLKRYVDKRGLPMGEEKSAIFADHDTVASWAARAVSEMARDGLLVGYPDGTFGPGRSLTRAQAATLLRRLCARRWTEAAQ